MPKSTPRGRTLKIISLGCSKNLVDSERLARQAQLNGMTLVSEDAPGRVDVVAVNTCGFIGDAKEESINTILEQAYRKRDGLVGYLAVFGCLSQRYRDELEESIPEVDRFFGKSSHDEILRELGLAPLDARRHERAVTTPPHYAYLKISEGCNRRCAFCAIPLITGRHKSEDPRRLLAEARFLASRGARELILVAQDLNPYGRDLTPRTNLYNLIDALSEIDGIEWIRLQYLYPKGFPARLPAAIASNPKLCHYIDIPFQHASDKILDRMGRGHTLADNRRIIDSLRAAVPDIAIRTTLITGFPGETAKDFDTLLRFVEESRFDRLGAFAYSSEEGTPAARKYRDSVSKKVKDKRLDDLMQLQQSIALAKNQSLVGSRQRVLVDRAEGQHLVGRTQYDSPEVDNEVLLRGVARIGSFVEATITEVAEFDLIGDITKH